MFYAFVAVFQAFVSCLQEPELRRLAMRPWLIGLVFYILAAGLSIYLHGFILAWALGAPEGVLAWLLYSLMWVALALLLQVLAAVLTLAAVMLFSAAFQTAIALKAFEMKGVVLPEEESGLKQTAKEVVSAVKNEGVKLVVLGPLILLAIVIGFLPILAPLALLLASWLLAYQFVDIALDSLKVNSRKRLSISVKNLPTMLFFGASLTLCAAIPFFGLFLPPVAVVAASWVLQENGLLEEVLENTG